MILNKREIEICKFIAEGKKNTEIAKAMYLSEHTIKGYISRIIEHFGAANRTQVAYILGKENIINF